MAVRPLTNKPFHTPRGIEGNQALIEKTRSHQENGKKGNGQGWVSGVARQSLRKRRLARLEEQFENNGKSMPEGRNRKMSSGRG